MKRIFAMILSVLLVFSLFACTGSEPDASTGESDVVVTDTSTDVSSSTLSQTETNTDSDSDSEVSSTVSSEVTETETDEVSSDSASTDTNTDTATDTSSEASSETSTDTDTTTPSTSTTTDTEPDEDAVKAPTVDELRAGHFLAITDQLNDAIVVIDLDAENPSSDAAIVWQWTVYDHKDMPATHRKLCANRLDDVRLRVCDAWGGAVVGVTSSSGLVALVEYPSGKCLFSADMKGYGPHSIEILPNGLIAVAASGNGDNSKAVLRIYSATSKDDTNFVEVPLASAHGVLWDPRQEVLWALGSPELNQYTVGGTRQAPTLTLKKKANIKFGGGHDLSVMFNNPDVMWLTGSNVAQYNKTTDSITYEYDGKADINKGNVKSINTFPDGVTAMTIADTKNTTAKHNTDKIRVFRYVEEGGTKVYKYTEIWFDVFDGDNCDTERDFYKVRAFIADYQ
ncbi:MAG: hypothetical protein J6C26_01810 [Clostridia bacterium]|nr:hypothetical protein [Clostridia bacterium]